MKMSVARILVRYLNEIGVRHIFGLIGHSNFDITDAIYLDPDVKFVQTQHEVAAGYMAASYAKATRQLGVCLVSPGAGATNLVSGIALAYKESCPVLAIAGDVYRRVAGKGASSWHDVPQQEIFKPITKMSVTLNRPEEVLYTLKESVRLVTEGRKGPVYLGIPRDVQKEEVDVPLQPWADNVPSIQQQVDPLLINRAAEELLKATKPTIIAGGGVHWANCAEEVRELAELLNAPFGTTPSYKGVISEDHSLSLGHLGMGASAHAIKACAESDLILAIGVTFSEGLTLGFGNRVIPREAKIVQVDIDPSEIGKIYPVTLGIIGDAKTVTRELIAHIKKKGLRGSSVQSRLEKISDEKKASQEERLDLNSVADGPITERFLYAALRQAMSDDTVVVAAGGTGAALANFAVTSTIYHSGDFRAIGTGVAMSIGVKLAFPEKPVVCVSGDGSFMLEMNELATAMTLNLPIVVIVVNNSAYGNMKRDQIRHYDGRVIGTELNLPDLCALAGSFGAYAEKVVKPSGLVQAIKTALAAQKLALLDVICPIEGID